MFQAGFAVIHLLWKPQEINRFSTSLSRMGGAVTDSAFYERYLVARVVHAVSSTLSFTPGDGGYITRRGRSTRVRNFFSGVSLCFGTAANCHRQKT